MSDPLPPLLPRAMHGGPNAQAFTGLDFSVNANPFGPNPALMQAALQADLAHYPDPSYLATRTALAQWHSVGSAQMKAAQVTAAQVALSTGVSDLLHRAVRAFAPAGTGLLSLHAPFGELQRACELGRVQVAVTDEAGLFEQDWPPDTRLLYIAAPHNPTGHCPSPQQLQQAARLCEQRGATLLLDLAYAPFLDSQGAAAGWLLPNAHLSVHLSVHLSSAGAAALLPSTIYLLSPGKAHGLVGLRPAYAVGQPEAIAALENLAPAWHVSAPTAASLAALPAAQGFILETLPQVRELARELAYHLEDLKNITVQHSGAPYMTLTLPTPMQASDLHAALVRQGLRTRHCASYGLSNSLRVSTRLAADNARLLEAIRRWNSR